MRKVISVFVVSVLLVCSLTVNSFADTGNLDFLANDLPYYAEYYDSQNGVWQNLTVSKSIVTHNNIQACRFIVSRASGNYTRFANIYKVGMLKANHEYSLQFSYAYTQSSTSRFTASLEILNGNGIVIQRQTIYSLQGAPSNQWQNVSVNFVPDLTNVNQGYTMRLMFEFTQENNLYDYTCYLSNNIYFNDNDDNSGWFQSIITWIQNVRDSISNIGSSIVSALSNLGSNISTWLTTVKDGIVNKLSDVITGINNKLETVKTYISDKIDGIRQWFIDLGEDIGEFFTMLKNYILYFKHPVTLNQDGIPVDSQGNPVYVNPFESALYSVEETINEWIEAVEDFIDSIDDSADTVSEHLSVFKNVFNRFTTGVPYIAGLIGFAVVLFVIRKVVGR